MLTNWTYFAVGRLYPTAFTILYFRKRFKNFMSNPKSPKTGKSKTKTISDALGIAADVANMIELKRIDTGDVIRVSAKLYDLFYKDRADVERITGK
jgi:hypothetical protein